MNIFDKISNEITDWHKECCFIDSSQIDNYLESKSYLFSAYYYCHLKESVLHFIKFVDMIFLYEDLYLEKSNCTMDSLDQYFKRECQNQNIYGKEWFKIVDGLFKNGNRNSVDLFLKEFKVFMKNALLSHDKDNQINFETLNEYAK